VHHHQDKKYAEQDAAQQEEYYDEPEEQYAPAPAAAPESDMADQLQQLAELHEQGVLTDEEFAAAKQKLLAS
jgi:hypothetical protein